MGNGPDLLPALPVTLFPSLLHSLRPPLCPPQSPLLTQKPPLQLLASFLTHHPNPQTFPSLLLLLLLELLLLLLGLLLLELLLLLLHPPHINTEIILHNNTIDRLQAQQLYV